MYTLVETLQIVSIAAVSPCGRLLLYTTTSGEMVVVRTDQTDHKLLEHQTT